MGIRERLRRNVNPLEAHLEAYTHPNAWPVLSLIHPIPKPDGFPSYTTSQQAFYLRAVPAIDHELLRIPGLLTLTAPDTEVKTQLGVIIRHVAHSLHSDPNSLAISPLYGTTPALTALRDELLKRKMVRHPEIRRIHPIVVSRSRGTQLVETRIFGSPDLSVFRDPSIRKIILEDIVDKVGVIDTLIEKISGTKPDNARERASLMEQYNIILAVLFSKNEECIDALKSASSPRLTPWQRDQYTMLQYIVERPSDHWMMGWGPDTGFEGTKLLSHEHMARSRELREIDRFIDELVSPLEWSELRIGSTLPGGYKLNSTYPEFLGIVSKLLAVEIAREEFIASDHAVFSRPKG